MTDFQEILDRVMVNMGKLGELLPKEMDSFKTLREAALEEGALDPKAKELMALGISIAIKCEPCITSHMNNLVKMGVTKEEIKETIGVAIFMGGGPSIAYGGKALEAFEQLSK